MCITLLFKCCLRHLMGCDRGLLLLQQFCIGAMSSAMFTLGSKERDCNWGPQEWRKQRKEIFVFSGRSSPSGMSFSSPCCRSCGGSWQILCLYLECSTKTNK